MKTEILIFRVRIIHQIFRLFLIPCQNSPNGSKAKKKTGINLKGSMCIKFEPGKPHQASHQNKREKDGNNLDIHFLRYPQKHSGQAPHSNGVNTDFPKKIYKDCQ